MRLSDLDSKFTPRSFRRFRILHFANRLFRLLVRYTAPSTAKHAWSEGSRTNLARGKPATQSSVSVRWSMGDTPQSDARGANNGAVDGTQGFHTEKEPFPWWQVDLETICSLREVRLYNRKGWADHLRHFSILASLDGSCWLELFQKTDDSAFGEKKLVPYIAQLPSGSVGRFVRIQLRATNYLFFNECQVFGDPT